MKKDLFYNDIALGECHTAMVYDGIGFNSYQLKIFNNKKQKNREKILKEKFPLIEEWQEIDDISVFFEKVFYIKKNKKYFVLKKSLELYEKYGIGTFWIGNNDIFTLSNDPFYNSLCTYAIHFFKDFTFEINYNYKFWCKFEANKYLNFKDLNDFLDMNFYGHGGLIWLNGNKITHEFIYNHSNIITPDKNKNFCDDCHLEIENTSTHKCTNDKNRR